MMAQIVQQVQGKVRRQAPIPWEDWQRAKKTLNALQATLSARLVRGEISGLELQAENARIEGLRVRLQQRKPEIPLWLLAKWKRGGATAPEGPALELEPEASGAILALVEEDLA